MEGQSVSQVADDFGIPRSTIGNWSAKLNQSGVPSVPTQKKEEIGERLAVLVSKMIEAQIAMLEVMADKDYLKAQDMAALSMGFGVGNDKLDRILARLGDASENQPTDD